jgi:peroxiredoxin Q/BCP
LNFPILSDESKEVIKNWGAWGEKKFMGRVFEGTIRKTYIINPKGEVVKTYEKVNPLKHAQQIIEDISAL